MKTVVSSPHYLIKIWYSDEDKCYLAEVPALRGCFTHGATYAKAAANAQEAMEVWLESANRHGDPVPEPDIASEEIARLRSILNVAKLARRAGINQHTLASKLRRGSRLTESEAKAVRRALEVA